MVNEVLIGLLGALSLLASVVTAFFTMCGGRDNSDLAKVNLGLWGWNKANRFWGRLLSPLLYSLHLTLIGLVMGNLEWWFFGCIASLWACTRLGHTKPYQRIIKAVLWASIGIFICIYMGKWWVLIAQLITALTAQVCFGMKNENVAPIEEIKIDFSMKFLTPFLLF